MTCSIPDCDREDIAARGMCMMHYRRWKRGRLDVPAHKRSRSSDGMNTKWPFEFMKDGDVWFRRPTGSKDAWEPAPGFRMPVGG